jgi:hypothetical protein
VRSRHNRFAEIGLNSPALTPVRIAPRPLPVYEGTRDGWSGGTSRRRDMGLHHSWQSGNRYERIARGAVLVTLFISPRYALSQMRAVTQWGAVREAFAMALF